MTAPQAPQPFHRKGLAYFWVFNDFCDFDALQPQMEAFAADGNVSAICLHPRPGLMMPYGSRDWWEFIRRICKRAAELDLRVWLYDEDPYPSGNAGGMITAAHPDLMAQGVKQHVYDPTAQGDRRIFGFPMKGPLIWAGLIREGSDERIDLTDNVGTLRRRWEIHERWDSRFFYPDTPRYLTPRADTLDPEWAMNVPKIPDGMKLVAYTAAPAAFCEWVPWGSLVNSLNPRGTELFLQYTHEKYKQYVGDMFGKEIEAIFTDEPKHYDNVPYTAGLFDDFKAKHGHDMRPYLDAMFNPKDMSDRAILTRVQYKKFVGDRFRDAWVIPVHEWCNANKLKFVGHISPEDDPVEQSTFVTNLFPLWRHFDLVGFDLIIPAVGDERHPIISIGVTAASSVAAQHNKEGTMCESGACSPGITAEGFGRILLWQSLMGLTAPLVHCAYSSVRGPREYEYPPNYGPNGDIWPGMGAVHKQLAEVQNITHAATQVAPVAMLWTIRSFNAQIIDFQSDPTGMRRSLMDTLAACLDKQIGTHFIDEADLWEAKIEGSTLTMGRASYSHLIVPRCLIVHEDTVAKLKAMKEAGISVTLIDEGPSKVETNNAIKPLDMSWCDKLPIGELVKKLPRLANVEGPAKDIRCTAWTNSKGKTTKLVMSLHTKPVDVKVDGKAMTLDVGKVYQLA